MAMYYDNKKRKRKGKPPHPLKDEEPETDYQLKNDGNEECSLKEDEYEEEETDNDEEEESSDYDNDEESDDISRAEDYEDDKEEEDDYHYDGNTRKLMKRLSKLSFGPSHNNGVRELHIKFSQDFLWKRHLICQSEIENFGKEDLEFRVWRLETRLGHALIQANSKWAKILSHHIPLDCAPTALSLAEQLCKNELQWSDKVVEIILCWLYCGDDGYCLMQTEKELLETCFTLEKMLSMEDNSYVNNKNNGYGDENVLVQRKYVMKLQECLRPLGEYVRELIADGKEHLPMDRRFRVNQMCEEPMQKLKAGEYGYAFLGTSVVAYRHGVVWEGLHVFNEGHVFAQDITLSRSQSEQKKYSRYFKYQEIADDHTSQLKRVKHGVFRLVFIGNPEAEIRSIYAFLERARKITENAGKDNSFFLCPHIQVQEFGVKILNTDENKKKTSNDLNLQEKENSINYNGDLRDLLNRLALVQNNNLQASLIVKNPTQETFFTIYGLSEVMGYNFENNILVVRSSVSEIRGLIKCVLDKNVSFQWRQNHSPRSILELVML